MGLFGVKRAYVAVGVLFSVCGLGGGVPWRRWVGRGGEGWRVRGGCRRGHPMRLSEAIFMMGTEGLVGARRGTWV